MYNYVTYFHVSIVPFPFSNINTSHVERHGPGTARFGPLPETVGSASFVHFSGIPRSLHIMHARPLWISVCRGTDERLFWAGFIHHECRDTSRTAFPDLPTGTIDETTCKTRRTNWSRYIKSDAGPEQARLVVTQNNPLIGAVFAGESRLALPNIILDPRERTNRKAK